MAGLDGDQHGKDGTEEQHEREREFREAPEPPRPRKIPQLGDEFPGIDERSTRAAMTKLAKGWGIGQDRRLSGG